MRAGEKNKKPEHCSDTVNHYEHTDKKPTKQKLLIALLQQAEGATLDEMAEATGWQKHSVHGVMSGVLRKKLSITIRSVAEERGRVYRIATVQAPL